MLILLGMAGLSRVSAAEPIPVLIDTDIGSYADDAFALGLALASPELEVVGITTCGGDADDRAWLVCRFLTQSRRGAVPVAAGRAPQPEGTLDWQIQYRRHPAAIFNRTHKPVGDGAVALMKSVLEKRQPVTIICLGPLTNIARLLTEHPEAKPWIKELVILGGALPQADGTPAEAEWNLKADVAAAQTVFRSKLPLRVVPADVGARMKFEPKYSKPLWEAYRPLAFQIHNLSELHGDPQPLLFDPVAVAAAAGRELGPWDHVGWDVDDQGRIVLKEGRANCQVLKRAEAQPFLEWMTHRLASDGAVALPAPPGNRSKLIPKGAFPKHVHVYENYNTDIEKRWWMSGKGETEDVPEGGVRAQGGVLTQDFDDLQGDMKTMYRAVVFNPVPGPPMGPRTRLTFKYKLVGTSTLRIQLYSLVNGYHRYLSVADLPQNEWREGTVDMTEMRRPDGTGGPLAADERIDDIQFYVEPQATVLIDDVILYEAAADDEKRPFPREVLFTGWFDTGKQGKEWPGDFEIVPHAPPRNWKHARSIPGPDGRPWIRVDLRGPRPVASPELRLQFKYRLTGATSLQIQLRHLGQLTTHVLKDLTAKEWSATDIAVPLDTSGASLEEPPAVEDVRFVVDKNAELALDDVLLYIPGP